MRRSNGERETRLDRRRREFLLHALSLGLFAGGSGWNRPALAQAFGKQPRKLPEGQSVFDARGEVLVNGRAADERTPIRAGDTLETGPDSHLIAAVGDSAFILRENSRLELGGVALVIRALKATGALLTVIAPRKPREQVKVHTVTATIGIRGTGFYLEAAADKTYLCTCYGTTELTASADPQTSERVTADYHDARYILAQPQGGKGGKLIIPAPAINHSDEELMMIEALVGREVPFTPGGYGHRPRREEY